MPKAKLKPKPPQETKAERPPPDPVDLIERLCQVMRKHGVIKAWVSGIEIELGPWVNPAAPVAVDHPSPPATSALPEERGDDGLTKTEAADLYASS